MPAHRKPIGTHVSNGGRTVLASGRVAATGRTEPFPEPPEHFSADEVDEFVDLWESAPATAWLVSSDSALVVELVELRSLCSKVRRRGEFPPGTATSRLGFLEDRLLLSPKARKLGGMEVVGSEFDE